MKHYYDPQLTIDIHYLFFAAFCLRLADYQRMLSIKNGSSCFFPRVLRAGSHFPPKDFFTVKVDYQVSCGLVQTLVAYRDM